MKVIKTSKKLSSFCLSVSTCLLVFTGIAYTENSVTTVTDSSFPQSNQIMPPAADGGQDIVTFVSTETMFNGYGSSVNDYITNYEWDFDGDGQYDWESAESGFASHIYNAPGKYNVFFRVTDSQGNSSIDTVKVQVKLNND